MEFLSAFDDQAWDRLYTGWELNEYTDRQKMRQERSAAIDKVLAKYPDNSGMQNNAARERELKQTRASWPDRYDRPRSWTLWPHD